MSNLRGGDTIGGYPIPGMFGTDGRIPKFNGPLITDSLISDDGTGIGIGTVASEGYKLNVNGNIRSYTTIDGGLSQYLRNLSAGSSAYTLLRIGNDTAETKIAIFTNSSTRATDGGVGNSTIRTDSGDLHLSAAGGQKLTIKSDGNLNINTADKGLVFYGGGEKIIGTADYGISFQSNGGTERMKILNTGGVTFSVGIQEAEYYSATNSTSFIDAAIQVRELNKTGAQTGVLSQSPRLAFHWSGRVAAQIGIGTTEVIRTFNNPGTDYAPFEAGYSTFTSGAETLMLKAGASSDHVYMSFYADSQAQGVRSGWLGYGSSGSSILGITNQMTSGSIQLNAGGNVTFASGTLLQFAAGQALAGGTTVSGTTPTQGLVFIYDTDQFRLFGREDTSLETSGLILQMGDNTDDYFQIETMNTSAVLLKVSEAGGVQIKSSKFKIPVLSGSDPSGTETGMMWLRSDL